MVSYERILWSPMRGYYDLLMEDAIYLLAARVGRHEHDGVGAGAPGGELVEGGAGQRVRAGHAVDGDGAHAPDGAGGDQTGARQLHPVPISLKIPVLFLYSYFNRLVPVS